MSPPTWASVGVADRGWRNDRGRISSFRFPVSGFRFQVSEGRGKQTLNAQRPTLNVQFRKSFMLILILMLILVLVIVCVQISEVPPSSGSCRTSAWQAAILSYRIGKGFGGSRARSCCSTLSALSISGWAGESVWTKIDSECLAPQF